MMTNSEKIDNLLKDINELEKLVMGIREANIYPDSFFDSSFKITHRLFQGLRSLEKEQLAALKELLEAHMRLIDSIQPTSATQTTEVDHEEIEERLEETEEVDDIENEVEGNEMEIETNDKSEKPEETAPVSEPIHEPSPEPTAAPESIGLSLNEMLEKKNLSDFRKAFSLNDRFRFKRELFGGNENKMNMAINELNNISSLEESLSYLKNILNWNIDEAPVADFIKLLEKRFS